MTIHLPGIFQSKDAKWSFEDEKLWASLAGGTDCMKNLGQMRVRVLENCSPHEDIFRACPLSTGSRKKQAFLQGMAISKAAALS